MTKESTLLKAGERIDELPAVGIKIIQSDQVFAFSLDAVILSHFVRSNHRHQLKIVDLCAGNGAVGLFLHEKLGGHFTEVEIQPRLADMARRSITLNGLDDRYRVVTDDLANVYQEVPKDSADIVVCNPPYFTNLPQSEKNPNPYLAVARHEIKTNLSTVVNRMSGLLKMNGHGYLVHRPSRLAEILEKLAAARLVAKRLQFIHPRMGRDANMVVIEVIKDGKPGGLKVNAPLIVHQGQGYSPAVKEMLYG